MGITIDQLTNSGDELDTGYGTVDADSTLRVAAQIGNATGSAAFGAGITSAQVLRVVLPTDQTAIPATQSGSWTVAATQSGAWTTGRTWTLASGTDSVASVQSGNWTVRIQDASGNALNSTSNALNTFITNSTLAVTQSGTWTVTVSNLPATVDVNYGTVGASTIRSAAQIGNATGAALFGAGTTTAQVLRVVLPTDQTAIPVTQSGTWNINNISGTISLPTGAATEATLSALNAKIANNYGAATGAVRTASQIGNTTGAADFNFGTVGAQTLRVAAQTGNATGAADFNAGATGAQTLRTTSNITRNGTELSYNAGTSDANTLRSASNLYNNGTALDYNFGSASANSLRIAALIGNATGAADFNFGTVGAQSLRTAAQIGNATGAADFNAGASGAQTVRTASNLYNNGTALTYNIGAPDANTLRVAAMLANTTGQLDYNYGTVGAQTLRTASEIGNATGSALFGSGTTTAQVLRVVLATDQTGINSFLDKNATGALTALNQTVTVSTNGMATAIVQVLGTFSANVAFEASIDNGATYFSVYGIYLNTNLIPITILNSTGQLGFYVSGYTNFRARISAFTSGTVNIVINTGAGSLGNIATQFVRLASNMGEYLTSTVINSKQRLDVNLSAEGTDGTAVPFGTLLVGGKDGSANLQSFLTDTSGNQAILLKDAAANGITSSAQTGTAANKQPLDIDLVSVATSRYSTAFSIQQTAGTAANSSVFSMRNAAASTKTIFIERITCRMGFNAANPITRTQQTYIFQRFSAATPTGGTAITAGQADSADAASQVTDIRFLDTGLTTTGVTFVANNLAIMAGDTTQGAESDRNLVDLPSSIKLLPGEGLVIRLGVAAVTGTAFSCNVFWREQ